MARLNGGNIRGIVGGVVFSGWKDIEVVKSAPVRRKNSWSEKQELHRRRFKAISQYCGKYRLTLIPQIWNLAAENGHGHNLFLQANTRAFAMDGQLTGIDQLHFSAGRLPFPQQMTVSRRVDAPLKLEVHWTNDENLYPAYSSDELVVVLGYPGYFSDPIPTGVSRGSGEALIDLPSGSEDLTGTWLFFRSNQKNAYSWDRYFRN